jgi:hypothetical protein
MTPNLPRPDELVMTRAQRVRWRKKLRDRVDVLIRLRNGRLAAAFFP